MKFEDVQRARQKTVVLLIGVEPGIPVTFTYAQATIENAMAFDAAVLPLQSAEGENDPISALERMKRFYQISLEFLLDCIVSCNVEDAELEDVLRLLTFDQLSILRDTVKDAGEKKLEPSENTLAS